MEKRMVGYVAILGAMVLLFSGAYAQQPSDGQNSYYLNALNPRFLTPPDTISCTAGRGVNVAANPDLDGDGKPEVLVTEYRDGGRVLVFEAAGDNKLEYVWGSKRLNPGGFGGGSTPRSVSVGDFDNDGKQEIIFQIGYANDDSLQLAQRGIYIYEFTGKDNDYGTEPVRVIKFSEIDTMFNQARVGRAENRMVIKDIDGDGKSEMLFAPRVFGFFELANLYILEVESGTFENGDAKVRVEYKYTDMAHGLPDVGDGFTPVNAAVGNIDADDDPEIVVLGWTIIQRGGGIGFIDVAGPDTYVPGSVVPINTELRLFDVKAGLDILNVNDQRGVIFAGGWSTAGIQKIWVIDNIVSDAFVSESDLHEISDGVEQFGIMAIGDQDHGTGSDGFDIYVSTVSEIHDIEYNGTGAISDPASYTHWGRLGQFNLDEAYDVSDGLFDDVYTFPGMDLDGDGNFEVVASYKGACGVTGPADSLEGEQFTLNTYGIFVFEWGDSTQSIKVSLVTGVKDRSHGDWVLVTPDDYTLEQNYPNPFNPETNIRFTLPLNKRISLKIYNTLGQEVRTLIDNEEYAQGSHTLRWDGLDNFGKPVPSGTYIYKLIFGNFSKSKTMTLVR